MFDFCSSFNLYLTSVQSEHVALIGDHKQLPPVITSPEAQAKGFGISLFERLSEENCMCRLCLLILSSNMFCSSPSLYYVGCPVSYASNHLSVPVPRVLQLLLTRRYSRCSRQCTFPITAAGINGLPGDYRTHKTAVSDFLGSCRR